ncbi:MAG: 4'-phosphopantetheinyl transferase superfamily protein [Rhodobacteraceae bacterium]|nr:4'-phosphopantetheinyl transferase superfamily protein [Paracoccaceae bacterium]
MIAEKALAAVCGPAEIARRLFPPEIGIGIADPRRRYVGLLSEEIPPLASMIGKRKMEYTAGRIAAQDALSAIGVYRQPVLVGPDRAPLWPKNVAGSISHCSTHCIAVVAHAGEIRSVGVDLEPDQALENDIVTTVCSREEVKWLLDQPAQQRGRLARLIFSAKECAYKAQYPLSRCLFGFSGLKIELEPETEGFSATFVQPAGVFNVGERIVGRYYCGRGLILTTCIVYQSGQPRRSVGHLGERELT